MILVDSDVLIANLHGVPAAQDWLLGARRDTGPLAVSAVSLTEVAGGMRSPERRQVMRLLSSMRGLGDCLIAATADVEGLELATLNVRHFPMIKDLRAPFRA
ncbi:MAG TPA: hypothetical protein VFX25_37915 [Streptosporangiaceae bacterium]|nr:hypothetical protein [Streptosporangiaceae bacterium]